MSGVAKILVVLLLILSVILLTLSAVVFSRTENWQKKYAEKQAELNTVNREAKEAKELHDGKMAQLQAAYDEKVNIINDLKVKTTNLETSESSLIRDLEEQKAQVAKLTNSTNKLADENTTLGNRLEKERKGKDEAISARVKAQKAQQDAIDKFRASEAAKNKAEKLLESAEMRIQTLEDTLAAGNLGRGSTGVGPSAVARARKPIDGRILEVVQDSGLCVISVGADDGVKEGYSFVVYRGDEYVGQVVVTHVLEDMAGAKINQNLTKKTVRVGDDISTRLYY